MHELQHEFHYKFISVHKIKCTVCFEENAQIE